MAYTTGTLSELGNVIGGRGKYWSYISGDTIGQITASGYITDAGKKRIEVGDVVFVLYGTVSTLLAASPSLVAAGVTSEFASGVVPTWQPCVVSAVSAVDSRGVPTVSATATLQPAVLPGLAVLPRNLIDCGDFTVNPWQIATSFNGTSATPTLTADRWNANSGGSLTWTAGRTSNTNVAGFTAAYVWGRSAGDTHTTGLSFGQVIETLDSVRVQGLPVTLSFYGQADAGFLAGTTGGAVNGALIASVVAGTGLNESSGKMFSGAWSGMTTVATQTITPTTAAQRFGPISGTVPTGATELGVVFSYSAIGTAGTHESVEFMGIQLEVGGMTPFEHTEVAEVVNIATRYLQVINEPTAGMAIGPASFSASSIAQVHIPFPSPMRQAPTLTFTAGGFVITDSALGAHTISAGGLQVGNTGAATLLVTAAATLTAGLVSFMQGRSTNTGILIFNADF